jgi:hypothetical protein
MADGGFLIKINKKKVAQCYKIAFSYDEWTYTTNFDKPKPLPDMLKSIEVLIEKGGEDDR